VPAYVHAPRVRSTYGVHGADEVRQGARLLRLFSGRKCSGGELDNAIWPEANASTTIVEGACATGFYVVAGKPYRSCDLSGTFTEVQNPCKRTRRTAPQRTARPLQDDLRVALLSCVRDGRDGTAIKCPAITEGQGDGDAYWPETTVGHEAFGTCRPGYVGEPYRTCTGTTTSPGTWGPIEDACTRTLGRIR